MKIGYFQATTFQVVLVLISGEGLDLLKLLLGLLYGETLEF